MTIDPKGLRGFRPDRRPHGSGSDETEGRMLYRARADAEARLQIALTRKMRMAHEKATEVRQ